MLSSVTQEGLCFVSVAFPGYLHLFYAGYSLGLLEDWIVSFCWF